MVILNINVVRPRAPNVQGLVEQSNRTMENMIGKMQAQTKEENWHKLINQLINYFGHKFNMF